MDYPRPALIQYLTSVMDSALEVIEAASLPCRNVISDESLLAWTDEIHSQAWHILYLPS